MQYLMEALIPDKWLVIVESFHSCNHNSTVMFGASAATHKKTDWEASSVEKNYGLKVSWLRLKWLNGRTSDFSLKFLNLNPDLCWTTFLNNVQLKVLMLPRSQRRTCVICTSTFIINCSMITEHLTYNHWYGICSLQFKKTIYQIGNGCCTAVEHTPLGQNSRGRGFRSHLLSSVMCP